MADSKLLRALKGTVRNYASLPAAEMIGKLRDPELVKKLKRMGVNEAQIHRIILIVQEHKPSFKELEAYLRSEFV